jgi:hypothetical protein
MRTDAQIVEYHILRLIAVEEPILVTGVRSTGKDTVALSAESMDGAQTYQKEYRTDGTDRLTGGRYSSLDRDAPEKILHAFERAAAHAFSVGGASG